MKENRMEFTDGIHKITEPIIIDGAKYKEGFVLTAAPGAHPVLDGTIDLVADQFKRVGDYFVYRFQPDEKGEFPIFHDFYDKVGDRSIPLIACGFTDTFCQSWPEASEAVLKAIKEVVADFGGSYVDTEGLLSNAQKVGTPDIYHFCKESLYILGGKFFEKYTQMREVVETEKV